MSWGRRIGVLFVGVLLAAAAAIGIYVWRAGAVLDGQLRAPGLAAPVTVGRDASDVTHIQAGSARDAWFGLGYVHAQERGWQLEFNRRLMHGELAEILGPAALDTDRLLRTLGIVRAAERQWAGLPPEAREAMTAYSEGIAAFHAHGGQALPPEFHLLRTKPGGEGGQAWSPVDSVGWALMMALDLGGNWGAEIARLGAARTVSTPQLWQLFPPYPGEPPASGVDFAKRYADLGIYRAGDDGAAGRASGKTSGLVRPDSAVMAAAQSADAGTASMFSTAMTAQIASSLYDWTARLGESDGKGSNNWVVPGERTASGKPLLANDPHLGLSVPAIWYFARLQAPAGRAADGGAVAGLDVIGATFPGLPFVVLGRTRGAAWSFTNTNPDVQDVYLEQIDPANPHRYRVPAAEGSTAWADFQRREERIRVKGQPDVVITVRESRHGPVISDAQPALGRLLDTTRYVGALRWAALDADNQTVLAGLRANRAQTSAAMVEAFAAYHSPMQNLLVADTAGTVAFKAVGKVPLRRADNDIRGIAPSPGWQARYDWDGWLPYADTPAAGDAAIRAHGGWATANQRITPPGYPVFIGQDWTVPYRQDRIEALLAGSPVHDMATMRAMQGDELSGSAVRLLQRFRQAAADAQLAGGDASMAPLDSAVLAQARQAVAALDARMQAGDAGPLVFAAWADEATRGIIGAKLGDATFLPLYGKRNFRQTLEAILIDDDPAWCGAPGCAAASAAAFTRALQRLQASEGASPAGWRWGRAHEAISAHRPFANVPWLARWFDVRVPTGGDAYTVNAGQYWSTGDRPFANRQAASMRVVYDLADLDKSQFIYQTGQSGLVWSPRYRDMAEAWREIGYRPLSMNPASMAHRVVLTPDR